MPNFIGNIAKIIAKLVRACEHSFNARYPRSAIEIATRSAERDLSRSQEADELLRKLRDTKRLIKRDQSALVANLGRLVDQFDPANAKATAQLILEPNEWEKRKRYIRFPDESVSRSARYAASGGTFARIIASLIEVMARKGIERGQAKAEVVRKVLRGTSFLPPPPFRMPANKDEADAALFAADINAMCNRLAHEADLADFFALVSKHPIFPDDAWYQWTNSLELKANLQPNHIYEWGWDTDEDEIEEWIPWWAPRCLIGHWYLPFNCQEARLPEDSVAKVIADAGGKPSSYSANRYYALIEPFLKAEHMNSARRYHRLPIWLIVLPRPNRLIPCLYGALHHPGGFYPAQQFPSDDDPVNPCFIGRIGSSLRDDAVFFPDDDNDDYNTLYVHISETEISAIGSLVDDGIANFKSDLMCASLQNELPEWLHEQPVQRFLKLTSDSDVAMSFVLASRTFTGGKGDRGGGTLFRPAFSDDVRQYTGLPYDSIAAFLRRNLVSEDDLTIFEALKEDSATKYAAAQTVLHGSISSFRQAFNQRFEVDPSG